MSELVSAAFLPSAFYAAETLLLSLVSCFLLSAYSYSSTTVPQTFIPRHLFGSLPPSPSPPACNAAETLLLHESTVESGQADKILRALRMAGVTLYG